MYLFLSITVQMGHDGTEKLNYYWSILEQLSVVFYGNTMTLNRFFHNLIKQMKIITCCGNIFGKLNDAYAKY
jgi:hypothetical protein